MHKDIIISILGALVIAELPCFEIHNSAEKIAMIVGMTTSVFILCLYYRELRERWLNYRNRVKNIERIVKNLRYMPLNSEWFHDAG